tara:strand:- start:1409 stop:2167 length:759 start_codon:yes stop_codon:yes gene_type:complete
MLGLNYANQIVPTEELENLKKYISFEFSTNLVSLLPILVLFVLSIKRLPAEISMMGSIVTSVILAVFLQKSSLPDVLNSLYSGYNANTGMERLDVILSRGGIESMMWTLSLALLALSLGGLLNSAGFVRVLMEGLLLRIKRAASLVALTISTGVISNMSMGEAYLSIIFGGQIFKKSYKDHNLEKHMLSRTLEEGATLSTTLIPWTTSGAFVTGILAISPLDFAPWAFFNYINPLLSILLAYIGLGIFRRKY